jgi:hypothetical protein
MSIDAKMAEKIYVLASAAARRHNPGPCRVNAGVGEPVRSDVLRTEGPAQSGFVPSRPGGPRGRDRRAPPNGSRFEGRIIFEESAMLKRTLGSLMAPTLLVVLASAAGAQDITSITTPTGPGGTGTAVIDPVTPSAADVSLNFTAVAPISFKLDVDGPGGYLIHTSAGTGGILNNTGVPWTSLLWEVSGPPGTGANTVGFDNPQYFANADIKPGYILLDQGTVPVGAQYNIDLGFATTQAGEITLTYLPNGTAVPEPSSLVLLALAVLIGATVAHWRHRRSRGAVPAAGC